METIDISTDNIWTIKISNISENEAWIIWSPNRIQYFSIPQNWNIVSIEDLYGNSINSFSNPIEIDELPILLLSSNILELKENTQMKEEISIYPNPTENTLFMQIPEELTIISIYLKDAIGRKIKQFF